MVRRTVFVFWVLASCATLAPAQVQPGSLGAGEPLPPPLAPDGTAAAEPPPRTAPDAGVDAAAAGEAPADADFRAATARFEQGDREGARVALEAFVSANSAHPAVPSAQIMLARLALLRGDPAGAQQLLDPLVGGAAIDPTTASRARYYLGLAEARAGHGARARDLLTPFLPKQPGEGSDESLVELRGALAEAATATGEFPLALELWDGYFHGAKEFERAYARQRAEQIAAQMSGEAAWRAFDAAPVKGLARAVLGARASRYLRAQADPASAETVDSETARARHAIGFEELAQSSGPGDPSRIGVALPLSGRFQPVGEAAMRAVLLATGGLGTVGGGAAGSQLVVRDTATDPDRAARSVVELTRTESVIGMIGSAERKTTAAAVGQATQEGLPLLTLDDQIPGAGTTAFQLVHSPEARVAELARRALKLGARDIAILGPDSAFGKRMREAFRREVIAGGGRITGEGTYIAGATSFTAAVAAIKKVPLQAIFVADSADRLELIAPALAVADLWPQPWGKPRPPAEPGKPKVRNVLLLSTANDLSPRLLQNAGRYVQGALLSPGFFADGDDPRSRAFVEAYRAAYGQDPHATEAYAYDGVALLRAATAHGARTRADLLKALGAGTFEGATGNVQFGPDHARVDAPLIYVVDGDDIRSSR
ncbi:MAG TPA: penicillin-binding protein activator [Polyangia bacterium]|jgi:ABC-type branched-subunit amino acid transport system substrate-binding protein